MSEDLEKMWREMVLAELRELNENQKKLVETIDKDVLRRLQTLEHLVIGVDGKNGIRGKVEVLENENKDLTKFKTQIITVVLVVQALGGIGLALFLKFF